MILARIDSLITKNPFRYEEHFKNFSIHGADDVSTALTEALKAGGIVHNMV